MSTLFTTIWKQGLKPEKPREVQPGGLAVSFSVELNGKVIGYLRFANGNWYFAYNPQIDQPMIVDFPKVSHTYESKELWPFFASRIPGLKQPDVQAKLKALQSEGAPDGIKVPSQVEMLHWFGAKTIANPFELIRIATAPEKVRDSR